MARRRGFFAELNHQAQLAERRRQQQARALARQQVAAFREAERAQRAAERARAAAVRADAAARREAERESARLYAEAVNAVVAAKNAELADTYAQIDSLLAATLDVDDYVDLERLRITRVDHPPFEPGDLATPLAPPPPPVYPPQPEWWEPKPPGVLGGRRRYEEALAQARAQYERACFEVRQQAEQAHAEYQGRYAAYQRAEQQRLAALGDLRRRYETDCRRRELEASDHNADLDRLINDLAFDVEAAIDEYVRIVLSNSVYPDCFPISHEHQFDLESRELTLTVEVPSPDSMPTAKEYRYVKARDEVAPTALPVREQKERYASAVWQVAIRSLHEVFEADRAGRIRSIALRVTTASNDPATGRTVSVPLVVVGADRSTFSTFDLANVVPAATLEHLGAAVSRNPFDLSPADSGRGVRSRSR
ncbi:hypothetical protein [Cryptosporangium aurantiacum]|uniref:Restriction system protein n=1 Tax=Cryptosporangium aurantiacum TaxID=134849 RepID=A0A1M7RKY4_9ACTN|nr:hypothetical protein [Cryptosporangium aurantiacum]SHN46967.1 restriction system protein [Cryptosporangium aurantiacum]